MTTSKSSLLDIFGQIRKPTWSCDLEPHLYTSLKTLWLGSHHNAHKEAFTVDAAESVTFMADNAPDETGRNAQTLLGSLMCAYYSIVQAHKKKTVA